MIKLSDHKTNYGNILSLKDAYRRAGGHSDVYNSDLSANDNPGTYYFRLFFHFNQDRLLDITRAGADGKPNIEVGDYVDNINENGTYHTPTENMVNYPRQSAYDYLVLNNEYERADKLVKFVNLLSDINTNSPWYFSIITGLESLERKEFNINERESFSIRDTNPSIIIKCLPDAIDNRIGTLLDLYNDICFSYTMHKEIVPANLRKFDMSLYIFNGPLQFRHGEFYDDYITKGKSTGKLEDQDITRDSTFELPSDVRVHDSNYHTSSKLIEFRNCEIQPNSNISNFSEELNNGDGTNMNYSIIINYDIALTERYNEYMVRTIGDMVNTDMNYDPATWDESVISTSIETEYLKDQEKYKGKETTVKNTDSSASVGGSLRKDSNKIGDNVSTRVNNAIEQVVDRYSVNNLVGATAGVAYNAVTNMVNSLVMGNLYGTSIENLRFNGESNSYGELIGSIFGDVRDRKGWNEGTGSSLGKSLFDL